MTLSITSVAHDKLSMNCALDFLNLLEFFISTNAYLLSLCFTVEYF